MPMTPTDFLATLLPARLEPAAQGEAYAPANIALAKYWGKRDRTLNLPVNGSLSISLGALGTGEYLIFGCVFCWVSYSLIGRRVLTGIDALTATTATALIGGVMLLAVSLAAEGTAAWAGLAHIAPSIWLILLALSFGATLLAYLWYFEGIAALGAGSTAAYMTLIPVFAVLIAALWLREPLTLSLVAGGTLTVCGMLLMQSGRRA